MCVFLGKILSTIQQRVIYAPTEKSRKATAIDLTLVKFSCCFYSDCSAGNRSVVMTKLGQLENNFLAVAVCAGTVYLCGLC